MTIAVNCRFLEREMRGVGRYASALAGTLGAGRSDVTFVASRRVAPHLEDTARSLGVRQVGPFAGPVWEQTTLPAYLLTQGRPLLLNLVNTAPLVYGPQVTVVYDLSYLRYPESFSAAFLWLYRLVVPHAIRRSLAIVTISEFVRREIIATFDIEPSRVGVVPCFVPTPFLRAAGGDAGPPMNVEAGGYALVVGSFNARKNLAGAIAAFRRAAVPGLRLVVVGEGGVVFRRLEIERGGDDAVLFAGAVSDDELAALYRGARFLIFPSLYEGFGLPPIEAMTCGCPAVVARAASMPEVCGDAAYYFDPTDTDSMAAAITAVARDGELRTVLRQRGLERAARFTLAASAARLHATLDAVLAERTARAAHGIRAA